jgi:protein-S-isoprenylcysteine O-methyltransferase Ste14
MTLQNKLADQGDFLFRWRSFAPLVLLFPGMMALYDNMPIEEHHGGFIEDMWVLVGFVIALLGLFIRWATVGFTPAGTSGRNTKTQRANQLNTRGMYSIVRNPLYLGNFFTILGFLISLESWWLTLVGCLAYSLYIERIIAAEERYLVKKFGDEYREWARKTPVFIPNFVRWEKSDLKFSYRTVLRREYNGLMAVCTTFFVVEFFEDLILAKEPVSTWLRDDWLWVAAFLISALAFLTLRTLKKHTGLLRVEGR